MNGATNIVRPDYLALGRRVDELETAVTSLLTEVVNLQESNGALHMLVKGLIGGVEQVARDNNRIVVPQ